MSPKRPPHPGEAEAIALRRSRVLDLRVAGASMRTIAREIGCAASTVCTDLGAEMAALHKATSQKTEHLRSLELARLDAITLRASIKLNGPEWFKASQTLLAVSARRARLLGLDAVEKVELSGRVDLDSLRARLLSMGVLRAGRLRELLDREADLNERESAELLGLREEAGL